MKWKKQEGYSTQSIYHTEGYSLAWLGSYTFHEWRLYKGRVYIDPIDTMHGTKGEYLKAQQWAEQIIKGRKETMPTFKAGDRVVLKSIDELSNPSYKTQEIGVGTIIKVPGPTDWYSVQWADGTRNGYPETDLTEWKDKTITTTKENILKTHAEGCSATKKALENLYPEVFKEKIDSQNVDKHFAIINGALLMSPQLSKELNFSGWLINDEDEEILRSPFFNGWVGYYMGVSDMIDWLEKIKRD
jgi:hypothetical protein